MTSIDLGADDLTGLDHQRNSRVETRPVATAGNGSMMSPLPHSPSSTVLVVSDSASLIHIASQDTERLQPLSKHFTSYREHHHPRQLSHSKIVQSRS